MNTNRHESEQPRHSKYVVRAWILGAVFVVIAAGGIIRATLTVPMPNHEGKTLDEWLAEKQGIEPLSEEAATAIRAMGTNALPHLLQLLGHRDSRIRAWAYVHLSSRNWSPVCLTPYYVIQGRGAEGIKALGTVAKPALSVLAKMFHSGDGDRWDVADALMAIEPEGIKVVQAGLSNTNPAIRCAALNALSSRDDITSDLIAAFTRAQSDSDKHVREAATNALSEMAARLGELPDSMSQAK